MTITIKYFASLRDQMGRGEQRIDADGIHNALQAWQKASGRETLPDNVLIAVNQAYAQGDTAVAAGDEVAFFPPVTGG